MPFILDSSHQDIIAASKEAHILECLTVQVTGYKSSLSPTSRNQSSLLGRYWGWNTGFNCKWWKWLIIYYILFYYIILRIMLVIASPHQMIITVNVSVCWSQAELCSITAFCLRWPACPNIKIYWETQERGCTYRIYEILNLHVTQSERQMWIIFSARYTNRWIPTRC